MPAFQDFIDELDAAGVVIDGREKFIEIAASAPSWPIAVTEMVYSGRKAGVKLSRKTVDNPSDQQLDKLLRGYPFTGEQCGMVVRNISVVA